jgi:hypothetical protein
MPGVRGDVGAVVGDEIAGVGPPDCPGSPMP